MTRSLLRVFLCYASQDKPAVRELYNALKTEGWIDPWLDNAKILPGQGWRMVIEKAVENADVVIVCLSDNSVSKEGFVQREIKYAYDIALEQPEETIFLIPLRLDDCSVPRGLRSFQWVDYFGTEKEYKYSGLLEALKIRYEQKINLEMVKVSIKQNGESSQPKTEEFDKKIVAKKTTRKKVGNETDKHTQPSKLENTVKSPKLETKKTKPLKPEIIAALITGGVTILVALCSPIWMKWIDKTPFAILNSVTLTVTPTPSPVTPTITPTSAPPTITPSPDIGFTRISEKDGMALVYVPAGEFTMGSDNGEANEVPVRAVYLDSYLIDQTEVTNKQYSSCVVTGICKSPLPSISVSRDSYYSNPKFNNYPVIYVDWYMAKMYCEWADRRLPSEAEWEKAASSNTGRIYPWGNDSPNEDLLNFNRFVGDTTEVGIYPNGAGVYGVLDMAGNVSEWVEDWFDADYYRNSSSSNPLSPDSGLSRVVRGGSWFGSSYFVRTTYRTYVDPKLQYNYLGFRCAKSP